MEHPKPHRNEQGGKCQRLWSTLFGGNAGGLGQPQHVTAVHNIGESVYAVGYTSMPGGAPDNYFPLVGETDAGYFFNPLYNYDGVTGGYTDGFITEFCNEIHIGVEEQGSGPSDALRLFADAAGQLVIGGLSDGVHELRVFDAQGRLVLEREVRSQGQRSLPVAFSPGSNALYLVVVDGQHAARFIPIR